MKAIVETITNIELRDLQTGDYLPYDRPAVMTWSSLMETHVGRGDVRVLKAGLPMEVSDEDFLAYWKESDDDVDVELAVAAYASKFEETDQERLELEGKAKELGIGFNSRTTDEKLREKIEEATS